MTITTAAMETLTRNEAFCQIYDRHMERIYRYHLVRTGSPTEAEELTAETFFAAWESFSRYRETFARYRETRSRYREEENPGSGIAAWLAGIARHKLADHFRRSLFRGKPRALALDEASRFPAPGPNPEEQAGERLDLARVAAALRRLNKERAEALALHYFAGMGIAEVAQVMGKREEAVKKLVQRGLAELQQALRVVPASSGRRE